MLAVERGIINFINKEAAKQAKAKKCPGCKLNLICCGPDSKTNRAEVNDAHSVKPTDEQIARDAACLQ